MTSTNQMIKDVEYLDKLQENRDYEVVHIEADKIIKRYLPIAIREAYEKIEDSFWYA